MPETQAINETESQLYEITQIPGKGRGLLARVVIPTGTRIICEWPLFTTAPKRTSYETELSIAASLQDLPKAQQREFLSLQNNYLGKPHPFSNIVKTNALPCGGPGAYIRGIYLTICCINHSCLANTHHSWNSNLGCETVHAIRDIEAGEEITICYDRGQTSQRRRAFLKEAFGFDCACPLCISSTSTIAESDARRIRIQRLDATTGNLARMLSKPDACLADCQALIRVLDEEYSTNSVLRARPYYNAFQIAIAHGDRARAKTFAERGYGVRVVCEGEDSPQTRELKRFVEYPQRHAYFGVSSRWRSLVDMVPTGLDEGEFEKWLWKGGKQA